MRSHCAKPFATKEVITKADIYFALGTVSVLENLVIKTDLCEKNWH